MTPEVTYWNGEPCEARKVTLVVADTPQFSRYWARVFVGTTRNAVEVTYNGETFFIDDDYHDPEPLPPEYEKVLGKPTPRRAGSGWAKVTEGRGSPHWGHANLHPAEGSVEPRA